MDSARTLTRSRFAAWTLLYGLAIVYSSTVVSETGFHFVPMDIGQAWDKFLRTPYLINGSDQRADWMANLVMFVPMGFLLSGALRPRHAVTQGTNALLAFALCVACLLAVKFLQLFFPGRTVSLNYITAQSIGSALGMVAFWSLRQKMFAARREVGASKFMVRLLVAYAFAYGLFMVLPLNFTLSAGDLQERLEQVPHLLFSWPGAGRPRLIRLSLVLVNFLASVPLGLLLAIKAARRSAPWYAAVSLIAMSAITILKIFVMSATPYLAAIAYTTAGMLLGVCVAKWIGRRQVAAIRIALLRSLPVLAPLYVFAVLEVNGLLGLHWRNLAEALGSLDRRGLIPFWNWYIVSKAQAAQSQVVHAIMFAPVGVMLSLRRPAKAGDAWAAAALAFLFALMVELGRWFRPGLAPDFYEAVTAALAAGLTVPLMRLMWRVLEDAPDANGARVAEDAIVVVEGRFKSDVL
jgi:VanZ family protein